MLLRNLVEKLRARDWFTVGVELLIVILGIFIGLQANEWAVARRERSEERVYIERLLSDSDSNVASLQWLVVVLKRRADAIHALDMALRDAGPLPSEKAMNDALCRWFVAPADRIQRGTYTELLSAGRLGLIRNGTLRTLLAREDSAHAESGRSDLLIPMVQRLAAPLEAHRTWTIVGDERSRRDIACRFDVPGMRADPAMSSTLAQLYRDQTSHLSYRRRELEAVVATRKELLRALGRPSEQ